MIVILPDLWSLLWVFFTRLDFIPFLTIWVGILVVRGIAEECDVGRPAFLGQWNYSIDDTLDLGSIIPEGCEV